MFRIALARATARSAVRPVVSMRVAGPAYRLARFESTKAADPRRKFLDARDELQKDWVSKEITYDELKPRTIQPTPDAFLIDVREKDEVIQGMVPSAVNVPLTELPRAFKLPEEEWTRKYGFPKPTPAQELIFYCRSGKRSATACDVAKRNGYNNIINYTGSWLDWTERERGSSS